jgi:hypothetical protein
VSQHPHEFGQSFARCSKFYMFVNRAKDWLISRGSLEVES